MAIFVTMRSGQRVSIAPPTLTCCTRAMDTEWCMATDEDGRWAYTCVTCGQKATAAVEIGEGHVSETRGGRGVPNPIRDLRTEPEENPP